MSIDVNTMKKGDVFATFDGTHYNDLDFIKATDSTVFAKNKGKKIEFDRRGVEINGYLFPRTDTIEVAIGDPRFENRRGVTLNFVKTKYGDVKEGSFVLNNRTDKTTLLPTIEEFSDCILNGSEREKIARGEKLEFCLMVVDDKEFTDNENMRLSKLRIFHKQEFVIEEVKKAKKIYLDAVENLKLAFKDEVDVADSKELGEIISRIPDCTYYLTLLRREEMLMQSENKNSL